MYRDKTGNIVYDNKNDEFLYRVLIDRFMYNEIGIDDENKEEIKKNVSLSDLYIFITDYITSEVIDRKNVAIINTFKNNVKKFYIAIIEVLLVKYGLRESSDVEYIDKQTLISISEFVALYKFKMLPDMEKMNHGIDVAVEEKSYNQVIYNLFVYNPEDTNSIIVTFILDCSYKALYDINFEGRGYNYSCKNAKVYSNKFNIRNVLYAITMPKRVITNAIYRIFKDTTDTLYHSIIL